jgi:hypothetical protein
VRVVQVLAFGIAASLVAGGAWAAVWFATPLPPPTEVEVDPAPKSVSATIHLNSDPQGAEATTSLGWSCQTPCSIELMVDGPFTVTFTHPGFVSRMLSVETEAPQPGNSDAKFAPDPVFAALQPIPEPKRKTEPAKVVGHRAVSPRDVHEQSKDGRTEPAKVVADRAVSPTERSKDGLVSRSWKYLQQKSQAWQMRIGKLIHFDFQ